MTQAPPFASSVKSSSSFTHQANAVAGQANLIKQQEELEKKAAELERKEQEIQNRAAGRGLNTGCKYLFKKLQANLAVVHTNYNTPQALTVFNHLLFFSSVS